MNHPPIPPNSPYFRESSEGNNDWHFVLLISAGEERWFDLDDMKGALASIWRPVIAAVACCAWRDEDDRILREEPRIGNLVSIRKCEDAFDAWRDWGKHYNV